MAFTDLLDALGGVGRFQLVYTALLLLPCGLLACHNFLQNFTAAMPPHHCRGPANLTNTSGVWLRATVPMDRLGALDSCRRFTEPQWVLLLPNASSGHGAATEGCVDGWEYDRSVFPSTIVTEWDLVCEARTLRDLAQSIYMAGVLLGAAVFGSLADRLGRKAPLVWSYLQLAVSGAATAYVSSFSAYCVFRFLMGMTFSGIILNSLSLVWVPVRERWARAAETKGPCRTPVGGYFLPRSAPGGHFAIFGSERTWLKVCLGLGTGMSSTRPWVLLPPSLGPRWLPESSRWLLLHGKSQQALQNLRKVAALNGREEESKRLTTEAVSAYVQSEFASVRTSSSVLDLFRTPAIRKVTCCLTRSATSPRFSNSVAYYGLAMDLHKFGLSLYLVQALFGIIDIPAMLLATITMIYVGRRATVASFLIMAGLTVIANMFVPEAMQTVRTAQAALGKGCLASSFICVYLFTGELYPTEIRCAQGRSAGRVPARPSWCPWPATGPARPTRVPLPQADGDGLCIGQRSPRGPRSAPAHHTRGGQRLPATRELRGHLHPGRSGCPVLPNGDPQRTAGGDDRRDGEKVRSPWRGAGRGVEPQG
uniref:Solute carrier family 22 member 20 n=1 Tax=Oryctolagus cuniculus TaxID=9986 RepID=A0A5F9CBP4_RABIT